VGLQKQSYYFVYETRLICLRVLYYSEIPKSTSNVFSMTADITGVINKHKVNLYLQTHLQALVTAPARHLVRNQNVQWWPGSWGPPSGFAETESVCL
jgi:hypothetical protein